MILEKFPDLQWLKKQTEQNFAALAGKNERPRNWPNVILNVNQADCFRDNIKGPLSIFTNVHGQSIVTTDKKRTIIPEGFYYVTNQNQYYTLEASKEQPTETFNIHFGTDFVNALWQSLVNKPEYLLEKEYKTSSTALEFHNRLNIRKPLVNRIIAEIKADKSIDGIELEEKLTLLATCLLQEEKDLQKIQERIPAARASTKEEVLKRLTLTVDYIYSNYHKSLSLEDLADVCSLSKFHFLRLFKMAYQKTPGEFIDEIRITKAMEMLKKGKLEIHEVARKLGYNHSSAFSRMFRNHVGVYPTQFS
jgi:AraC family transcriptional regulator